jgi:hypothetical protein
LPCPGAVGMTGLISMGSLSILPTLKLRNVCHYV